MSVKTALRLRAGSHQLRYASRPHENLGAAGAEDVRDYLTTGM